MGMTLAALQVARWYDLRRNFRPRCAELIAEIRVLREDFRDGSRSLRTEFHKDAPGCRSDDRDDFADQRKGV